LTDNKNKNNESTSHILIEGISDHLPIMLLINSTKQKNVSSNNLIRDTQHFKKENFAIDLNTQINDLSISSTSIEEQFENLVNILHNVVNKHAPIRKKT